MSMRLTLLLAAAVFLMAWTFAVPIFEAPDEPQHWMNARYIHDRWSLPPYNLIYSEGGQAPLYYLLMAPFALKSELPRMESSCPPRLYHNCATDVHRYQPVRAVRILTALLSVFTVLFVYLAGKEATGNSWTGLLAGGLVAFLPGFTFRGMNVSNDAMVALASAAATYGIVRLLRRGFVWRVAWFTAFAAALAFLAKMNGIVVGVVLALVLVLIPGAWWARCERLLALMGVFLITTPWLLYNQLTYGDALTMHTMESVLPSLLARKSIGSAYFLGEFPVTVGQSFIGFFGWMSVPLPNVLYRIFGWATVLVLAGLVWRLLRIPFGRFGVKNGRREAAVIASLAAIVLLAVALLVRLNLTYTQPQGRLLFPALAAVMVLAAMGLEALPFWNARVAAGALLLFAAMNVLVLVKLVMPVYWAPHPAPQRVDLDFMVGDNLMSGPTGPLNPGTTYGQTFVAQQDNLTAIDLLVATYKRQLSRGVLKLHLRLGPAQRQDLATVAVPASSLRDCTYVRFTFPPIPHSAHHAYYAMLETQGLATGEYVTVFLSAKDVYPGGSFWVDGVAREQQDTSFGTFYVHLLGLPCPVCASNGAIPEEKVFRIRK